VVVTHRVLRLQLFGEPTRGVGGVVLTVALPRLVDPDGAVVEVDIADPQGADLTEPKAGADRHAQQVAVGSREPHGGLQLSLREEPQLRTRLLHA
jgi:hypothetical protein